MIDEGDIEDPQTGLAASGVEIFAARLNRQDFRPADPLADVPPGMLVRML